MTDQTPSPQNTDLSGQHYTDVATLGIYIHDLRTKHAKTIANKNKQIAFTQQKLKASRSDIIKLRKQVKIQKNSLAKLKASSSWRITSPIRRIAMWLRR